MTRDDLADIFAPFGPVSVRRMFGGLGAFRDGRMFAIVAGGELYMKTDSESRGMFEEAGAAPFVYEAADRQVTTSYWRLPAEAFDDPAELERYTLLALEAAARADAAKARRRSVRTKGKT